LADDTVDVELRLGIPREMMVLARWTGTAVRPSPLTNSESESLARVVAHHDEVEDLLRWLRRSLWLDCGRLAL
jgi:hypothetical protein